MRYNRSVEFRTLGPLQVLDGDREVPLGSPKERALLAVLLLHARAVVSRERLIEELWGESPPPTAAKQRSARGAVEDQIAVCLLNAGDGVGGEHAAAGSGRAGGRGARYERGGRGDGAGEAHASMGPPPFGLRVICHFVAVGLERLELAELVRGGLGQRECAVRSACDL
jgi:hypothetical protein